MESINPESSERTESKAKVKLFILEEDLLLVFVENCKYPRLDLRFIESIKTSNMIGLNSRPAVLNCSSASERLCK